VQRSSYLAYFSNGGNTLSMKVLMALTYYRPHTSGLTIYAERLARALAERGHPVTVLTSQYEKSLPRREQLHGVEVVRVPVAFHVSKGVIMPTFGAVAWQMVRSHDVLSLHLPQFDASGLAARGQLLKKPVVLTYHCDLKLPPSLFSKVVSRFVFASNVLAAKWADAIVTNTDDYAAHSPFLSRYLGKVKAVPPPIDIPIPSAEEIAAFRTKWNLFGQRIIGVAARLAAEKGIQFLVDALPRILEKYPNARVLFVGPYQNVIGEEAYARYMMPLIEKYAQHWTFLGSGLTTHEMAAFFASCDCVVLPSLNSTESFGMVQVEAMLCGTPAIATDLPGVRQPIKQTQMGEIVPARDSAALADAILRVLSNPEKYQRGRSEIESLFSTDATVTQYVRAFTELAAAKNHSAATVIDQRVKS
jgi:glycosyltransferase involved in cell wall biosynthesis